MRPGRGRRRPCLAPAFHPAEQPFCPRLLPPLHTAAPCCTLLQVLECLAVGEEPPDVSEAVAADPTLPSWELDAAELERQLAQLHGLAEGLGVELKGRQLEEARGLEEQLEEQRQLAAVIEGFKARRHGCRCRCC